MKYAWSGAVTFSELLLFSDEGNLIILGNGFQKKSQKTPKGEIEKALKIKTEYEIEKRG